MPTDSRIVFTAGAMALARMHSESWAVQYDDDRVVEFDHLVDAIDELEGVMDDDSDLTFPEGPESLLDDLTLEGRRWLFGHHDQGWGMLGDFWVPAAAVDNWEDYFESVERFGGYGGEHVELYRWDDKFLYRWQSPEGVEGGWVLLGNVHLDEAKDAAKEALDELSHEMELDFEPYMGLENVPDDERSVPPRQQRIIEEWCTGWSYDGSDIASLQIAVHAEGTDAEEWLVIDQDSGQVIGRYRSMADVVSARVVHPRLSLTTDDLDGDG
jgi:hypothetical protein